MSHGSQARAGAGWHAALGIAALAPLALLVWPFAGSLVDSALEPALVGAALLALATLPALALAALTRHGPAALGLTPLYAYALVGFASLRLAPPADTLEADRASLLVVAALGLALVGASATARARELFVAGLPWLALLAVGAAFLDGEEGLGGVLQNTGATSEAALAGALVGAWSAATGRGLPRAVGGLAWVAYAVYVGLAPVLAGLVSLAAALALAVAARHGERRRLALLLGLALLAFGAARALASWREAASAPAAVAAPSHTGGVAVRLALWRALPAFVRDHGLLGAGPGQFRASFAPYRDPAEIALERRALGAETEVEHVHNDWLQGWCDGGWLGGTAWSAFLVWTALNALAALRAPDRSRAALALVALGLLANAALRAPLLWNPASAASFYFAAGALAARPGASARRVASLLPWLALALGLALVATAVSVLRLGRELDHAKPALDLARALERRDDSVLAWSLSARELERQGAFATAKRAWQRVLDHRPFHVEAWVQLGLNALKLGERAEAKRAWTRALALDPTQPAAARNLYVLALRSSERAELEQALAGARGVLETAELVALAANATLAGRELGFAALRELVPDLAGEDGVALEDASATLAASGETKLADALDARLALESARAFAAGGAWHDAVRLYRQALRLARKHGEEGGSPLKLEFAAALARDGEIEDARAELAGQTWSPDDLALVPDWAGAALLELGLLRR